MVKRMVNSVEGVFLKRAKTCCLWMRIELIGNFNFIFCKQFINYVEKLHKIGKFIFLNFNLALYQLNSFYYF